ncbi:MAG: hypothetical protein HEP71_11465 [Roseivirga sp.]|nr:hypothetical protein [Roseivirga sp.]
MSIKKSRKVIVIFPRGEAIANFLSDVFIQKLKEGFSEIHFLTFDAKSLSGYTSLLHEVDSIETMERHKGHYAFRFMSSFLDLAHNLKIKTVSSKDRIRFRRAQAFSKKEKFKLELTVFFARFFANGAGTRLLEKMCEAAHKWLNNTKQLEEYIDRVKPDVAFNTSHIHGNISELYLYTLRQRGVKLVSFIFSWDNITSQGRIIPHYNQLFTWNNESKDLVEKYYGKDYEGCIKVTGTPQFDHYFHYFHKPDLSRAEFCESYGLDSDRPLVLYSTGMPHHMPGEPIIVKRILDCFEQEYLPEERPQLILRVYPKDHSGRFEPLRRLENIVFQDPMWNKDLVLPSLDAKYILKQTLRNVDMGINIASTITLELLMFDKKVLNIAFTPVRDSGDKIELEVGDIENRMYSAKQRAMVSFKDNAKWYEYDHYKDVAESDCILICRDENKLNTDIRSTFIFEPSRENKKKIMDKKFSGTLDGQGIVRIVESLNLN